MSELTRRLTPATLFMLSLNGIIGSGWLLSPFYSAKIAGVAAIISWLIGGSAAILIALTFAELSTMLPIAGGSARIPQLSHGAFASFILGWIGWLTGVLLVPMEVQAILQYASLFFPSLMQISHGKTVLTHWGYVWATLTMALLCIVNTISYKNLIRFNFVLFFYKNSWPVSNNCFTWNYTISNTKFYRINIELVVL